MTTRRKLIHPGKPLDGHRPPCLLQRFINRTTKHGRCWLWTGCTDENGYGRIKFRGRSMGVHRVAYFLFRGDVPAGQDVDHCRKGCPPHCCNPDHLRLLSRSDNSTLNGHRRGAVVETADTYDGIPV